MIARSKQATKTDMKTKSGLFARNRHDRTRVLVSYRTFSQRWAFRPNLRDFPASALAPHGVVAVHPDDFLSGLHDADPELLRASTEAAHANLSRSAPSLAAYLDVLDRQGLPQLTRRLRM